MECDGHGEGAGLILIVVQGVFYDFGAAFSFVEADGIVSVTLGLSDSLWLRRLAVHVSL